MTFLRENSQKSETEAKRSTALVARDRLALRKVESLGDSEVVGIPLVDVAVTCGEMGGDEAER